MPKLAEINAKRGGFRVATFSGSVPACSDEAGPRFRLILAILLISALVPSDALVKILRAKIFLEETRILRVPSSPWHSC